MYSNASCACVLRMCCQPSIYHLPGFMPKICKQSSPALQMTASGPLDSRPKPWLLVGLGNPGKKYEGTRHNVGFEMIDTIAQAEGISMNRIQFKALFGKVKRNHSRHNKQFLFAGHMNGTPILLAKPQTFMNISGESVGPLVAYFKIPLNQVLLIFDDMDLPFATLRLLPKGGHGGHNGMSCSKDEAASYDHWMRSIIDHFKGTREFPRLRIGIGRPPGRMDAADYVLCPFNKKEREEMDVTLQEGLEAVRILTTQGFDTSATIINSAQKIRIQNS